MSEGATPVRPLIVLPADPERLTLGGIASFVRGFVKYAPADFEISILGMSASRPTGRWSRIQLEGRPVDVLPMATVGSADRRSVPLALRYVLALAWRRPDVRSIGRVLQFHRPATAVPLLRTGLPCVRVIHQTLEQLRAPEGESTWRRTGPLLRLAERATLPRMDRVYVVNEREADRYRARFPALRERIAYLPNWVDDAVFKLLPADERRLVASRLIERLELEPESELVLSAGRLERTKRPALLLQAFRGLLSRRPAARLLIAGAGELLTETQATASSLGIAGQVRFLGLLSRAELARVMNAARLLMITSVSETGPTVGIEALASGLPVVMTPVGQVSRIAVTRETGWVTGGHDAEQLAEGAQWILQHVDEAMRRRCQRAAQPYAARSVLPQIYEDHRALASAARGSSIRAIGGG